MPNLRLYALHVFTGGNPLLVLTRHKNECIVIGDNVRVHVVEIRGDKVRLGIQADKAVPVDRMEVRERKDRGKK